MSNIPFIQAKDVEGRLSWFEVTESLIAGHQRPRGDVDDILFNHGKNVMLNRAAWIEGMGIGIKSATLFPENAPDLPSIHAIFTLFSDKNGTPQALIDGILLTKWKTAADSMLGARFLARKDSKNVLIVGAGAVAASLIPAYREIFPDLECVNVWGRNPDKVDAFAKEHGVTAVRDLERAAQSADIISCATISHEPILKGQWIQPGTHVDLIGAYRGDMREADDELMKKGDIYVDARETTIHDIGEIAIPIKNGVISEADIKGDLYDLCTNKVKGRTSDEAITVYKNGGGAHLDLMTAGYIQNQVA